MVERCLRAAFLGIRKNDGDEPFSGATKRARIPGQSARAHAARAEELAGTNTRDPTGDTASGTPNDDGDAAMGDADSSRTRGDGEV
jgi:hypothetical protein